MIEKWKDIPGYEGLYQASTYGKIKSLERFIKRCTTDFHLNERILHNVVANNGYNVINLCINKKTKLSYVHRLVALSFIPNPENKPQVNHIDGNKKNNKVENLEWVTISENSKHSIYILGNSNKHGLGKFGILHSNSVKVSQFSIEGVYIRQWDCIKDAERALGICQSNISSCCKGKRNKAGGFTWKYS